MSGLVERLGRIAAELLLVVVLDTLRLLLALLVPRSDPRARLE